MERVSNTMFSTVEVICEIIDFTTKRFYKLLPKACEKPFKITVQKISCKMPVGSVCSN